MFATSGYRRFIQKYKSLKTKKSNQTRQKLRFMPSTYGVELRKKS